MKLRAILIVAVGLLVAADDKKDDAAVKAEKAKLMGSWAAESMEFGGEKAPDEAAKKMKLTFTEDKATLIDGDKEKPATYIIDPSKKPATLDITPAEGPDKGKVLKAIYAVDGDTLKIAIGGPDRPTEFVTKKGEPVALMTFKRAKP